LGAVGVLLLIGGAVSSRGSTLAAGGILLVLAGVCGLILAPHFESKVIERSSTDPSKFRSPAAVRQMVPKRVSLKCVDDCPHGLVAASSAVSLRGHGMPIKVYRKLCGAGYTDEWTSRNRAVPSTDEKTVDEHYSTSCLDYSRLNLYGKDIEVIAKAPTHGPWKITWKLKDPTGRVSISSAYTVEVKPSRG
jgi:hypothetical protein